MYRYPARLERDDNDTYLVRFPDVPEAVTFGEDVDDAISFRRARCLTGVWERCEQI